MAENDMNSLTLERTEDQLQVRRNIDQLEQSLRDEVAAGNLVETIHDGETDEGSDQCNHYFAKGVYVRSLVIPSGHLVVGRIHLQSRVCVVAAGRCTFIDEFRKQTVSAPWIGEFEAGSKTAVFAHETTLWIAISGTDIKDPKTAVAQLTALNHEVLLCPGPE
jgi:hypothetical protein